MALGKDTISINLAKGVNTKTDDKIAQPDQMSILRNARFDEDLRLSKRPGITGQSLSFQGDPGFLSPVAFSATNLKSKSFAHDTQLCVANNGSLFSQYSTQNKWVFKGTYKPIEVTEKSIDSGVVFTDSATSSGVTVALGFNSLSASIKYIYVFDEATGNLLSKTTLAGTEVPLRVVAFSSAIYVLTAANIAAHLNARPISLTTGAVGSIISLKTDLLSSNAYVAVTSGSTLGEVAFILYPVAGAWHVFPMDTSGGLPALGAKVTGLVDVNDQVAGITIETSVNPNKFYVADPGHIEAYTFTSGAYTNVYSTAWTPTVPSSSTGVTVSYMHLAIALSPVNNTDLYVFVDTSPPYVGQGASLTAPHNQGFSDDCAINMISISSVGAINSNSVYGYGYILAGSAIRDANLKSIYLPCAYYSPLQPTILLMDALQGNASKFTYVFAKALYGLAYNGNSGSLCQTPQVSSGVYRIVNNGYIINFNLTPTYAPQSQFFANTTHLTGGMLWAYDGITLAEHNFLIAPENFEVTVGHSGAALAVTVVGDASHREAFTLTMRGANFFNENFTTTGAGAQTYFQFNTTAAGYYAYYTVDGVGPDPAVGGRTKIGPIALLSTDSSEDVAGKTATAINSAGIAALASFSLNVVTITNAIVGAVTAPTLQGKQSVNGLLSAGTYSWTFVYKWTDRNGQVYRSAPAVPISVAAASLDSANLIIWAPPITDKTITSVYVEVYRTQVNGSEYQLLGNYSVLSPPTTMQSTGSRLYVLDNAESDTLLNVQPILYTNGGILENSPTLPALTTISFFKERLVANSVDDKFAVYYSKSNVKGEPVNFTQETFFRVDAESSPVAALAYMDDKLCVFKTPLVYVVSGDGANDLGEGSTLTQPMAIATDVGCTNPNSLVLYPNGLLFKSDKGIYCLNRSLGVEYTGSAVESFNQNSIAQGVLMENSTEVRYIQSDTGTALVYNYFFKRWDYFTNYQMDSACIWQKQLVLVNNAGRAYIESSTNYYDYDGSANVAYSMYLETPWLRLKGVQDFQRIYRLALLGEYISPHTLTFHVYYDYDSTNFDTYTLDGATIVSGTFPGSSVYDPQVNLVRQKCQSMKVVIFETPISGTQQSCILNEMGATVGLKTGLNKVAVGKTT